jgi:alkylhydroperoxidase/carboxymuconolactone decarboxylase family protein YurZ
MGLDELLARGGLPAGERLLIRAQALIWPGRWEDLAACFTRAQAEQVPRSHLEELLLQAILFCGFPRVIHGFRVLEESWPAPQPPAANAPPPQDRVQAGQELFTAIYQDKADTVQAMLKSYHGELHDFVLDTAYGRILSRSGLPPRTRELIAVGALAVMDQIPQLVAHGRGALHFGAEEEQVFEAIYTALGDTGEARRLQRKVVGV